MKTKMGQKLVKKKSKEMDKHLDNMIDACTQLAALNPRDKKSEEKADQLMTSYLLSVSHRDHLQSQIATLIRMELVIPNPEDKKYQDFGKKAKKSSKK